MNEPDQHQEIRDAVRHLCNQFPDEYFRRVDEQKAYPEKFVESIRAPVGADIGAVSPSEIAVSIITDIVATKYGKELPHKDVKQPASLRTPGKE